MNRKAEQERRRQKDGLSSILHGAQNERQFLVQKQKGKRKCLNDQTYEATELFSAMFLFRNVPKASNTRQPSEAEVSKALTNICPGCVEQQSVPDFAGTSRLIVRGRHGGEIRVVGRGRAVQRVSVIYVKIRVSGRHLQTDQRPIVQQSSSVLVTDE